MKPRLSDIPTDAHCDDETLWVSLADGRRLGVPLAWFPSLLKAKPDERAKVEVGPSGLHWPLINEDISLSTFLGFSGSNRLDATDAANAEHGSDLNDSDIQFPKHLFRYRSVDTEYCMSEIREAIDNNSVFLSAADVLNDPFDFRPSISDADLASFKRKIPFSLRRSKLMSRERYIGLCCANQLTNGSPLSPDGFIPRLS